MEERVINLTQFLQNRTSEIASMQNLIESKYLNATKHPYQALHKHLKRRAMSHNRYRIPSRLRKQMNVDALAQNEAAQKIVRCRKHLRKNKQQIFLSRSNKVSWMETHLFQVKRMRMITYADFKVALQAHEKNFRAVHRYLDHGCCIFDASYYFIVDGNVPGGLSIDDRTIIHPKDCDETDYQVHKNDYCIFQVFGLEALTQINLILSKFNVQIDGKRPYYLSLVSDNQKIQQQAQPQYREIRTLESYDTNMRDIRYQPITQIEEDLEQQVWNVDKNYYLKRFQQVIRGRYTHKGKLKKEYQKKLELERKNKVKQDKKQQEEEQDVDLDKKKRALRWLLREQSKFLGDEDEEQVQQQIEGMQQIDHEIEIEEKQQEEKQKIEVEQKPIKEEKIFLLVIPPTKDPKSQIDIGYKLVVNLGQGIKIWRLFYYNNIKSIGLRDIKQMCLEELVPFQDFDETNEYERYLKASFKPDYYKLQFPYPFNFNWGLYEEWKYCQIVCYRSTPERFGLILQPTDQDLIQFDKGVKKIPSEQVESKAERFKTQIEVICWEKMLEKIELKRKILGFILFGNQSLKFGKGIGQGKVDSKLSGKEIIVLIRNRNSNYYFFSDCKVL